jgi:hypothetical protein
MPENHEQQRAINEAIVNGGDLTLAVDSAGHVEVVTDESVERATHAASVSEAPSSSEATAAEQTSRTVQPSEVTRRQPRSRSRAVRALLVLPFYALGALLLLLCLAATFGSFTTPLLNLRWLKGLAPRSDLPGIVGVDIVVLAIVLAGIGVHRGWIALKLDLEAWRERRRRPRR